MTTTELRDNLQGCKHKIEAEKIYVQFKKDLMREFGKRLQTIEDGRERAIESNKKYYQQETKDLWEKHDNIDRERMRLHSDKEIKETEKSILYRNGEIEKTLELTKEITSLMEAIAEKKREMTRIKNELRDLEPKEAEVSRGINKETQISKNELGRVRKEMVDEGCLLFKEAVERINNERNKCKKRNWLYRIFKISA